MTIVALRLGEHIRFVDHEWGERELRYLSQFPCPAYDPKLDDIIQNAWFRYAKIPKPKLTLAQKFRKWLRRKLWQYPYLVPIWYRVRKVGLPV